MSLTQGSNYAFHALIALARLSAGQAMSVDQLARNLGASPSYMAKLLQQLVRAQLVESERGSQGGYFLARPVHTITLWDVVSALSNGNALAGCIIAACSDCPLEPACPIEAVVRSAEKKVAETLSEVTVNRMVDLLDKASSPTPGESQKPLRR